MQTNLTVIVLTHNEELNIEECLRSLVPLKCRIVVVDSGSTDKTLEIVQNHKVEIYNHEFNNYGDQRNWAQQNTGIETDWVLHIDADERLNKVLCENIINVLMDNSNSEIDGYLISRRTIFMGKFIRYGGHYPVYHNRMFRIAKGMCETRLYDQHFIVDGIVEKLSGDIIDVTDDLDDWFNRHMKWAEMEAEQILGKNKKNKLVESKLGGTSIERRRWMKNNLYYKMPLFLRCLIYFGYRYFVRLGVLDGYKGLIFHFLHGFWYRFKVDTCILKKKLNWV
ncbi:MAG: glycosyltransferase family 2 protein [SAR202 cluster bacterium]|nr:glycosyltransferase family 2 protein [SAR202 cluster bacterium]